MTTPTYAGIGARATPAAMLSAMTKMAAWLARTDWQLNTGGADGADSAFAAGAPTDRRTVWLPWPGYNGHRGPDCRVPTEAEMASCMEIASGLHPAWHRCSPAVRKLHARNVAILGVTLGRPVDAVVAFTSQGRVAGGTGMGIRIARAHGIPVLNLGSTSPRAVCERLRDIRGPVSGPAP